MAPARVGQLYVCRSCTAQAGHSHCFTIHSDDSCSSPHIQQARQEGSVGRACRAQARTRASLDWGHLSAQLRVNVRGSGTLRRVLGSCLTSILHLIGQLRIIGRHNGSNKGLQVRFGTLKQRLVLVLALGIPLGGAWCAYRVAVVPEGSG